MRVFATTKRDNNRGVMRVELNGTDIELLVETVDRLERLVKIEAALDVVAMQAISIDGSDWPTATAEGAKLLKVIVEGWDADKTIEYVSGDANDLGGGG